MPQLDLSKNKNVYCFPEGEKKRKEKNIPETYLELCLLIHSELCVQAFVSKFLYYFQPLLSFPGLSEARWIWGLWSVFEHLSPSLNRAVIIPKNVILSGYLSVFLLREIQCEQYKLPVG